MFDEAHSQDNESKHELRSHRGSCIHACLFCSSVTTEGLFAGLLCFFAFSTRYFLPDEPFFIHVRCFIPLTLITLYVICKVLDAVRADTLPDITVVSSSLLGASPEIRLPSLFHLKCSCSQGPFSVAPSSAIALSMMFYVGVILSFPSFYVVSSLKETISNHGSRAFAWALLRTIYWIMDGLRYLNGTL